MKTLALLLFFGTAYGQKDICNAVGTAANPSVARCGAATKGIIACSVIAAGNSCQIRTTAIRVDDTIRVAPIIAADGLNVTCNSNDTVANIIITSLTVQRGFSISLPKFTVNPACYVWYIERHPKH